MKRVAKALSDGLKAWTLRGCVAGDLLAGFVAVTICNVGSAVS